MMGLGSIVKTFIAGPVIATLWGENSGTAALAAVGTTIVGMATVAGVRYLLTRKKGGGSAPLNGNEQKEAKNDIAKQTGVEVDKVQLETKPQHA